VKSSKQKKKTKKTQAWAQVQKGSKCKLRFMQPSPSYFWCQKKLGKEFEKQKKKRTQVWAQI
jgi:hypothetical protein